MGEFSKYLGQLRKESGFKTPHEFWLKNGGKKVFGFSYVNYWKIEKGKLLPRPERLNIMAICLRLGLGSEKVKRLILAYLRELLGTQNAFDWIVGLIAEGSAARPEGTDKKLLRQALQVRYHSLKPEQEDAIYSSYAAYWIWATITDSFGVKKPEDLAEMFGVKVKEILSAAKTLAGQGLVKISSRGINCPIAGKSYLMSPSELNLTRRSKLRLYQARMIKAKGEISHRRYNILRADNIQLQNAYRSLDQALSDLSAYAIHEKTPSSHLFLAETNIVKLFKY